MIEGFEGRVGSGKSFAAVRRMVEHLSRGLTVATNITLNWDGVVEFARSEYGVEVNRDQLVDLSHLDDEKLGEFYKWTPKGEPGAPVLVVIDEAHLIFNARDWAKTSRGLLAFLTQSRKHDTDIIFISQAMTNVDKQFRVLFQYIWRFRDLRKTTVPGLGIRWDTMLQVITFGAHSGEMLLACNYDYDGKTLNNREFVSMDKRIFACYNTRELHSSFSRSGQAKKVNLKKSTSMTRGGVILRVVMVLVLCAIGFGYWMYRENKAKQEAQKAEIAQERKAQEAAQKEAAEAAKAAKAQAEAESQKAQASAAVVHVDNGAPSMRSGAVQVREIETAAKAEYEIFAEQFRAFHSQPAPVLRTSGGNYSKGRMSSKGYVVAVADREAMVMQPNGRLAWVVADEVAVIPPPLSPSQVAK